MSSDTPTLSQIAQSIIDRLAPLQDVGLIVRRQPNTLKAQGITGENGIITLSLESVTGAATDRTLAGARQAAPMVWLLSMRLRNVRGEDGIENLYDWLTGQLFGWTPIGAAGPITLSSFTPQPPVEDYWPVQMRLNIPGLLLSEDETIGPDEAADAAAGATLLEAIFSPIEITDRWGVNSGIVYDPSDPDAP
ncbi:MAG: hypothetical protein AAFV72_00270 [Cyanobacteria bacterium J06635_1]